VVGIQSSGNWFSKGNEADVHQKLFQLIQFSYLAPGRWQNIISLPKEEHSLKLKYCKASLF